MSRAIPADRSEAIASDPIALELFWQRLLAILEEASWAIVRSSFSSAVREAWDFSCLVYDAKGRLLAQNSSVSGKIGVWHTSIDEIVQKYPIETLQEGDVIVTNDPWLTEGHLYDTSIVMPLFQGSDLIGFGECVAHLSDIGGSISNEARDVYEEGLQIPICKLFEAGVENQTVRDFIETNVRTPEFDIGDLRALVTALRTVDRKLAELLQESNVSNPLSIADAIIARTESATRAGIRERIPDGRYSYAITGDGFDEPIHVKVEITVKEGAMTADFAGSSSQSRYGINCPPNYAQAWTVFAIKSIVSPDVPHNYGSFIPIEFKAPSGSILNPRRPAPVRMRASVAHFVTPCVQGALAEAAGDRAIAESGSPGWIHRFFGQTEGGSSYAVLLGLSGGSGARVGLDGVHALNYPTNMAATSTEILEEIMPVLIREKSIIPDSGGAGKYRGGGGQRFVLEVTKGAPIRTLIQHERTNYAARGARGGASGRTGVSILNGEVLPSKTQLELKEGDVLEIETPGAGGMGPPAERDPLMVVRDVKMGFVSRRAATAEYSADSDWLAGELGDA